MLATINKTSPRLTEISFSKSKKEIFLRFTKCRQYTQIMHSIEEQISSELTHMFNISHHPLKAIEIKKITLETRTWLLKKEATVFEIQRTTFLFGTFVGSITSLQ